MTLTIKDFRPAKYNPRTISDKRLGELSKSYDILGDLSGIVFNQRTKTTVSGHQRLKSLKGKQTKVETHPHKDAYGTVAVGYVHVRDTKKNKTFKIPLRIVDWSSSKMEKAANIAANAHGGEWDKEKLAVVLADLQDGKFNVELTGLDPITIRSLRLPEKEEKDSKGKTISGPSSNKKVFKDLDEDSVETEHQCPRCKHKF